MRPRSLFAVIVLLAAVPGVTRSVFAQPSARLTPAGIIIVDRNIFEIDPHTIGDTKVVVTIVGGQDRL